MFHRCPERKPVHHLENAAFLAAAGKTPAAAGRNATADGSSSEDMRVFRQYSVQKKTLPGICQGRASFQPG